MILLKTSVIDDKSIISLSYLLFFFSKLKLFSTFHKILWKAKNTVHKIFNLFSTFPTKFSTVLSKKKSFSHFQKNIHNFVFLFHFSLSGLRREFVRVSDILPPPTTTTTNQLNILCYLYHSKISCFLFHP